MGIFRSVGNFVSFGAIDRYDAKQITKKSKHKEDNARRELEVQKNKTQATLNNLGDLKASVYSTSLEESRKG